jgi:hypothetical protein
MIDGWRWVVLVAAMVLAGGAQPAAAAPALVAIDDATPTLEQGDDAWSGALALTNLDQAAVTLEVTPAGECKPTLSKAAIGAAQAASVTLTVPEACAQDVDEIEVELTAAAGTETQTLTLATSLEDGDDVDFRWLLVFPGAAILSLVLVLGLKGKHKWGDGLQHLEKSYDFKESWVSNVTVIAGILTGIFGSSSVVEALIGEEPDDEIALATVGAAIALLFIGAGPIVLTAARKEITEAGVTVQAYTVYGLLLATAVTLAGAAGQLVIGALTGLQLIGGDAMVDVVAFNFDPRALVWIGLGVGLLLLVWYTRTTVTATLKAGSTAPPPAKPSELARIAELLQQALLAHDEVPNGAVEGVVREVMGPMVTEPPPAPPPDTPFFESPRRSAAIL